MTQPPPSDGLPPSGPVGPPPAGAQPPAYGAWPAGQPTGSGPAYGAPPPYGAVSRALPPDLASAGRRFGAFWLNVLLAIVTLGIGYVVWTLIVWKDGQNPAFQLLHMRTIDAATGAPIGWGRSFLRNFLVYGVLFGLFAAIPRLIGSFWVFGEDRQAVWDKMLGTFVVSEPQR